MLWIQAVGLVLALTPALGCSQGIDDSSSSAVVSSLDTSSSTTSESTTTGRSDTETTSTSISVSSTTHTTSTSTIPVQDDLIGQVYEYGESSERVRGLQSLLGIAQDGIYGPATLVAHRAALLADGRGLENLRPPEPRVDRLKVRMIEPGGTAVVTGSGFEPGAPIRLELHSRPRYLAATTATSTGTFTVTVGIPTDTEQGEHDFVALGPDFLGRQATPSTPVVIGVDTSPPVFIGITASTTSVDITNGPATFTVDLTATDEGTGIIAGGVTFTGCANGVSGDWNDLGDVLPDGNIITGTNNNGTWRIPITVQAGIPACTLQLLLIDICDAVNQCVTLTSTLPPLTINVTRSD